MNGNFNDFSVIKNFRHYHDGALTLQPLLPVGHGANVFSDVCQLRGRGAASKHSRFIEARGSRLMTGNERYFSVLSAKGESRCEALNFVFHICSFFFPDSTPVSGLFALRWLKLRMALRIRQELFSIIL